MLICKTWAENSTGKLHNAEERVLDKVIAPTLQFITCVTGEDGISEQVFPILKLGIMIPNLSFPTRVTMRIKCQVLPFFKLHASVYVIFFFEV